LMAHVRHAPQARPNLLLAALHERVLAGVPHDLAAYYPSVGGERAPDAALADSLHRFVRAERPRLLEHLRLRSTQTNEIGRCAVLWPALQPKSNRARSCRPVWAAGSSPVRFRLQRRAQSGR